MKLTSNVKKIRKLIKNPNLFFYDYFRKKTLPSISLENKQAYDEEASNNNLLIDIVEIKNNGLNKHIKKHFECGLAPTDGYDENSLLLWSGYLNGLIQFISHVKKSLSMDLTIYTLGGGYNIHVPASQNLDFNTVVNKLSARPDFVVELSNQTGLLYIIHIYQYDINNEGIAVVRSNRAIVRKCLVNEIEKTFTPQLSSYNEDIDAVYTWVNQSDPEWQKLWLTTFPQDAFDPDRYTNNDELRYSLRSLNKYAPWINKIYIISNCSKPSWLNESGKVIWVEHKDIFPSNDMLPTFNSHAIECNLHHIEGLAEKFIYLNDDFILTQPCLPSDFYDETGRSISYFERYGMVNPKTQQSNLPDYLVAAKNSNLLLKKIFPEYDARNLHRHVPYALKKSVLDTMEKKFPDEFRATSYAKLRSEADINLTSFLYHHYSYANGTSVKSDISGVIVRPENISSILNKDSYKYKILCFNDGNGSSKNISYKNSMHSFFKKRLAESAPWEISEFIKEHQE